MIFVAAMLAPVAITGASPPSADPLLTCLFRETDRIASDPSQIAELRRWTRAEATRFLWSLAGDSDQCAELALGGASNAALDAAYLYADRLVADRHLYRD